MGRKSHPEAMAAQTDVPTVDEGHHDGGGARSSGHDPSHGPGPHADPGGDESGAGDPDVDIAGTNS
eukprot:3914164-Heterocapsa_arctica.AAC.1